MTFRKSLVLGSVACMLGMSTFASAKTIAQFNFDASTDGGQTFTDISGNGHNAFFNRPVKLQDENPFGTSDGKDKSVVEVTQSKSSTTVARLDNDEKIDLSAHNQVTLEAWVNPTKYPEGKNVARVIQLESKTGGTTNIFLGINGEGKAIARLYAKGAGTKVFTGSAEVPLNKWTHLALVYDGSNATLYVNGKETAKEHAGRSLPKSLNRASIGSHLSGAIDDVRISDEALSAEQLGLKQSFTGQGSVKSAGENGDKK